VIRFHLDERVDPSIATALRQRGIDVSTAVEAGLLSAPDNAHLEFALRENRVIVTGDADFLRLHRHRNQHAGIVYLPHHRTVGEMVHYLQLPRDCLSAEEMTG
jgi:predicted nuclease of predicted toxin-antitoxin system